MTQKVLITGGAGFIGNHLAGELLEAGHRVRVLDNLASQVHGEDAALPSDLPAGVEMVRGDVRSPADVRRAIKDIDVVYHFAASVGVGQSMYQIRHYTDNNNVGTASLLEALAEQKPRRLIVASSMSLYGEGVYRAPDGTLHQDVSRNLERLRFHDWEPRDAAGQVLEPVATPETKRPNLASVYALSKFDQEQLCLIFGRAYGVPTVALRFFNVYGPGQALSNPYTGVMAIFASRLLNGKAPLIFEDGNQRRDFVHVSDVVRCCRLAMERERIDGETFNVGSGENFSVAEIARQMARSLGKAYLEPEITMKYRQGDIRHCFADIGKARELLGYQPSVTLGQGINDLAEWLAGRSAVDRTAEAGGELAQRGLAI
ncbi:MAG: NAD-dependent epimerase/dehydratase family protein [Deltaproteobacteria bacterium]|nr:NAD-dependent epimerase/dehydratase family protein [Deltaproteobacteria bacterium]